MCPSEYSAAAFDLDGTLKPPGKPASSSTVDTLRRLRSRGVRLILVTGRCLEEAAGIVPLDLFDRVVAENGAVLSTNSFLSYRLSSNWIKIRSALLQEIGPGCEKVIVSMGREKARMIEGMLRDLGGLSEASIQVNKDRAMVIPRGVDKGTGLNQVLSSLGLSQRSTVGFGDGENDVALFKATGYRVAVANSVPALAEIADYVTQREDGEGVCEAVNKIWGSD